MSIDSRQLVTVVLPTYNRAHLLPAAIGSVLGQTYVDFELLVVDDGSKDDTERVVTGYADPRVRYLRQPTNAGVSAARNRGLREAKGEFVAFLDSDDTWAPDKLAVQVRQFAQVDARVGLLYCGATLDSGNGQIRTWVPTHRGDVFRELLIANVIHGTSGVILRREVTAKVGFFDEEIPAIEDYEYWLRTARFFWFDYVEQPLFRYSDTSGVVRKSLNLEENRDARAWLYRRHGESMRRAGVAHLFLQTSAKRHLASYGDPAGAIKLAAQAAWLAPTSARSYRLLARSLRALARRRNTGLAT